MRLKGSEPNSTKIGLNRDISHTKISVPHVGNAQRSCNAKR